MDSISGLLKKPAGGASSGNPILDSFMKLLHSGQLGNIQQLIGKFASSGLAAKAASWVGIGNNEALHPDEVEQALGADTVAKVATDAGVSHDEAKTGLAAMLPKLIDHLTPGGVVPTQAIGKLLKGVDFSKILGG
jgi:uncharacterized protein YidB (DUF937 family)